MDVSGHVRSYCLMVRPANKLREGVFAMIDGSQIVMGLTWLISTGIGVLSTYPLLKYRIGKVEGRTEALEKEVKEQVIHVRDCDNCKKNIELKIQLAELERART